LGNAISSDFNQVFIPTGVKGLRFFKLLQIQLLYTEQHIIMSWLKSKTWPCS